MSIVDGGAQKRNAARTAAISCRRNCRRAKQGEVMYGDADLHREVVAQAIGL